MKKRFFVYSMIGLVALLVLFVLMPTILSTDMAKRQVIKVINRQIPGRLSLDKWSLGWVSGIQCQGVAYKDNEANISVRVDRIAVSKGLLALVLNYQEPGLVEIIRPRGTITLPGKARAPGESGENETPSLSESEVSAMGNTPSDDRPARSGEKKGRFILPPIVAEIKISNGSIKVIYPNEKEEVIAKDLMVNLNLDEIGKPITYQLLALAGTGGGQISGQGSLSIPSEGADSTKQIRSSADITLKNWNLAPLLAIGSALSGTPSGSGMLNGQFQAQGDPTSGLHLTGQLTGTDIRLTGGKLKSDTPSLKKITCDIDAIQADAKWRINRLVIDSLPLQGSVKGRLNNNGESLFQAEAAVNLAEISGQLPATLNLKPGTRITHGQMKIKATVETTAKTTRFDGSIHLDRLAGNSGPKKLALNEPLAAAAAGSYGVDGIHLDTFSIQSAFLSGKGQGDLDDLTVELKADLRAALKEAGKFIDIKGWRAAGKLNLALHAGALPNARHFVEVDLDSDSLQLSRKNKIIVPKDRFNARLRTDFQLDGQSRLGALLNASIDFNAGFGKGQMSVKKIEWPTNRDTLPRIHKMAYDGTLSLKPLTQMMHALNIFPGDINLSGKADIHTRLSGGPEKVAFKDTTIIIDQFIFQQGNQLFKDKKIDLQTQGNLNLSARSARLIPLKVTATSGNLVFSELIINDWADIIHTVKGNGKVVLNLAALTPFVGSMIDLPEKTKVTGRAKIDIKTDLNSTKKQILNLLCTLAPVKIKSDKEIILDEDSIKLAVKLKGDLAGYDMAIEQMTIAARPLSLNATGRLSPIGKEQLLSINGDLAIDLEKLQKPISALLGTDVKISGKSERPFAIDIKTENGQWGEPLKRAVLTVALHADRVDAFGLAVKSIDIPLKVEKSLARSDIRGVANEGELLLAPRINLASTPPVLTMPDDSIVLNKTQITKDMANKLLALIHPIFKGTAAVQGSVDLTMHHFSWPLPESARKEARFAGTLKFNDLSLNARGLIYDLLTVMKVKERDTVIGDRTIDFKCENGRIQCSPLRMTVKDYQLELSGSMGFDGTLDYLARIPVTPELVGKKAYVHLKDAFLDIPIGGTISKPELNMESFQVMLEKLIHQAGGKLLEKKAGELLKKLFD